MRKALLVSSMIIAGLCLAVSLILPAQVNARVYIDINQPFARKIPVAVPDFTAVVPGKPVPEYISRDLALSLGRNLDLTGLFIPLDRRTFLETNKNPGASGSDINFRDWVVIGAELLVKGGAQISGQEMILELKLYDVFEERMLLGKRYKGTILDGQAMINRFINEIMLTLTGERGVFGSMIAFVGKKGDSKEIFLTNFGSPEVLQVTRHNSISLSPVFSRLGHELAYISYKSGRPELYVRNLTSNIDRQVSTASGLYLSPCFTATGDMLVSISEASTSNIFRLNNLGREKIQLTRNWGINISPTISPDGSKFAFVSDRSGSPQIYVSPLRGGEAVRITFEGEYNTDPAWSPRGDRLVYVGHAKGFFNIYTIAPDGSDRQQLTSTDSDNTRPTWSPDGRLIAFSSNRLGRFLIFTMTANGEKQRPLGLNFDGEQTLPSWSPVRLD